MSLIIIFSFIDESLKILQEEIEEKFNNITNKYEDVVNYYIARGDVYQFIREGKSKECIWREKDKVDLVIITDYELGRDTLENRKIINFKHIYLCLKKREKEKNREYDDTGFKYQISKSYVSLMKTKQEIINLIIREIYDREYARDLNSDIDVITAYTALNSERNFYYNDYLKEYYIAKDYKVFYLNLSYFYNHIEDMKEDDINELAKRTEIGKKDIKSISEFNISLKKGFHININMFVKEHKNSYTFSKGKYYEDIHEFNSLYFRKLKEYLNENNFDVLIVNIDELVIFNKFKKYFSKVYLVKNKFSKEEQIIEERIIDDMKKDTSIPYIEIDNKIYMDNFFRESEVLVWEEVLKTE